MDLRSYYSAIRQIAAGIERADVVVVSRETADGGRAGMKSTVPRQLAAKLIVEGRALLEDAAEEERTGCC
jgi:hypothetical protein